jgi:hypothetical protein
MSRHERRAVAARTRATEQVDIPMFVTWATLIAAGHPEEERADLMRKMVEERPELCPCCLLRFIVDREVARGWGEDVAPLVVFGGNEEIPTGAAGNEQH